MWNLFYGWRGSGAEISSIMLQSFITWPLSFLRCLTKQCLWSVCTCAYALATCRSTDAFKFVDNTTWLHVYVHFGPCVFDSIKPQCTGCRSSLILSPEINPSSSSSRLKVLGRRERFSLWLISTLTAQQEPLSPFHRTGLLSSFTDLPLAYVVCCWLGKKPARVSNNISLCSTRFSRV